MRFFGTEVIKYSIVMTDAGKYRVMPNGTIEKWDYYTWRWEFFDTNTIDTKDVETIRYQGVSALELTAD